MAEEKSLDSLNSYLDVLREISNIGSGNAATALAQMMDKKIDISIPKVDFLEFKQMGDELGGADSIFVGILFKLSADIEGMMMYMVDIHAANVMINAMIHSNRPLDDHNFTEIDLSVMQEIGNILSCSYLNSLSMLTNLTINPSIPYVTVDMVGAMLSVPAIEIGKISDHALFIESKLFEDQVDETTGLRGYFLLVP